MQAFAIRHTARSVSRVAVTGPRSSPFSTTVLLKDAGKPDAAGDSMKRGAQNVGVVIPESAGVSWQVLDSFLLSCLCDWHSAWTAHRRWIDIAPG